MFEKLRKLQRVVHVLCAPCALGFRKDGQLRKLERYILTSRHGVINIPIEICMMIQQEGKMQDGYTFAGIARV